MYKIFSLVGLSLVLLSGCGGEEGVGQPAEPQLNTTEQRAEVAASAARPAAATDQAASADANVSANFTADDPDSLGEDEDSADRRCRKRCTWRHHRRTCRVVCS